MSEEDPSRKNFFSDIVSSVSRAKFSLRPDEPYIYSRDYVSVHIWDIRKTQTPMQSYHINDYIEKRLCEVYESEAIFDKFDMQVSPNGAYVLTGSYNGNAHVIDLLNQTNWSIDVKFMDKRGKNVGSCKSYKGKKLLPSSGQSAQIISQKAAQGSSSEDLDSCSSMGCISSDLSTKIPLCAWHPKENTFAVSK